MNYDVTWLREIGEGKTPQADGLVDVKTYRKADLKPEEVAVMERAERYEATAVFFEAGREGRPASPQAFIFVSKGGDPKWFAKVHQRLWSWGGVPLAYLVERGVLRVFRCAHGPEFEPSGDVKFKPYQTLKLATDIANDPWWSRERLRNGSLWTDAGVAKKLLKDGASQKELIEEVKRLYGNVRKSDALPQALGRKLLVLSLMIAYLEKRGVLLPKDFGSCVEGATEFFEVLGDGPGLVRLLDDLEKRFNGNVFELTEEDRNTLRHSDQLSRFATLIEAKSTLTGQRTLWERYSFADLPVELISQIYQLFVSNPGTAVYTPQALVRLMVSEALSPERIDRLRERDEVILDPACGSGVFLVEAYKRLVLHWRSRRNWGNPSEKDLRDLLEFVRGVDLDPGAVELASFSLCLALCDALEPESMRNVQGLFPKLIDRTILQKDFFAALEEGAIRGEVGVILGNPPFESKIETDAGKRAFERYRMEQRQKGRKGIPDKQVAYLFLHESMKMLQKGGMLSLLQGANFLYNEGSKDFRKDFLGDWNVREILDFISVRGMFKGKKAESKSPADTKVIVVIAEAEPPVEGGTILHAIFRRTPLAKAHQRFELDSYDMHWLSRSLAMDNDGVWRSDLFGGRRVLGFVDRLKKFPTLEAYVGDREGWLIGEGFAEGASGKSRPADHIIGKPLLSKNGLSKAGILEEQIEIAPDKPIEGPRTEMLFTPPMVLIDEQLDLNHGYWDKYLTYKNQVVGVRGPRENENEIQKIDAFFTREKKTLQAYAAATSVKAFNQHSTTLAGADIKGLPFPLQGDLRLSSQDEIVVDDVVDFYRDLIRAAEKPQVMRESEPEEYARFDDVFLRQFNAVYRRNPLSLAEPYFWLEEKVTCRAYAFQEGAVDWEGAEGLRDRIESLLRDRQGSIDITRIARIYDGNCIFLLKPDGIRYWLRSTALRDADEVLADLWDAGY